jgi:signal transduction histidine kinase
VDNVRKSTTANMVVIVLQNRYYRVQSSEIQYSGLGLGLYISAEIIQRQDGQIGVESEINGGSTFWFTIPLRT